MSYDCEDGNHLSCISTTCKCLCHPNEARWMAGKDALVPPAPSMTEP